MTNLERLISLIGFAPSNNDSLQGALIDFGINGADTYTVANKLVVKKAAIQVIQLLLSTADTNNGMSNGAGFEIKYDRQYLLDYRDRLKKEVEEAENGVESNRLITGKTVW